MKKPVIPIFYACDDFFVKYMIVSLRSMIENASKDRSYHIYVLHTNISEEMKQKMYDLQNENFEVSFEDVTEYLKHIADRLPIRHYYTKTTYFRLFIAEMFPQYQKAIYIDSDTVVQGDISKLYDIIGNTAGRANTDNCLHIIKSKQLIRINTDGWLFLIVPVGVHSNFASESKKRGFSRRNCRSLEYVS